MFNKISLTSMERLELMILLHSDLMALIDLLDVMSIITDVAGENPPAHVMEGVRGQVESVFWGAASA